MDLNQHMCKFQRMNKYKTMKNRMEQGEKEREIKQEEKKNTGKNHP